MVTSRKFAEILASEPSGHFFNEGFRDVLIADECFFQSVANYFQRRGQIDALWASTYFDDARVLRIDEALYKQIIAQRVDHQMFARKAASIIPFAEFFR